MKKRLLGFLCALTLMLSLMAALPMGVFAFPEKGTESDPYIVSTYDDLQRLLDGRQLSADRTFYVKLGADIYSNDSFNDYDFFMNSSYDLHVTLDLAGHNISRTAKTLDTSLFFIGSNASLTINDSKGSGVVSCDLNCGNQLSDLIHVAGNGELTINGGTFDALGDRSYSENCIWTQGGETTINGGTFKSFSMPLFLQYGDVYINDGTFVQKKDMDNAMTQGICAYLDQGQNFYVKKCMIIAEEGAARIAIYDNTTDDETLRGYLPENAVINVDGKNVAYNDLGYMLKGSVITIVSPELIESVNLTVTEPKSGESPRTAVTSDNDSVIPVDVRTIGGSTIVVPGYCQWYSGSKKLTASDTFEAGKTYTARISLRTDQGMYISEKTDVTVNGKAAAYKSFDALNGCYNYACDFTTAASDRKKGDVVKNDKIDNADLLAVKSHIKKIKTLTGEDLWAADVDGNGAVNNTDLIAMKAHIKGVKKLW